MHGYGLTLDLERLDTNTCLASARYGKYTMLLLTGVLPHAFMMPARNTGTYVISHCLKTGEFCSQSRSISI